jgi:membrane fusion protein (multidrug efflux system)
LGQEIKIEPEDGSAPRQGRITSIAAAADSKDRTFAVEVTVDNPDRHLKPGMIVSVNLVEPAHSYISIPLSAIVPFTSEPEAFGVMVAEQHDGMLIAKSRRIQVGAVYEDSAAVEGVQVGERVVSAGAQVLKDGEPVQIIP